MRRFVEIAASIRSTGDVRRNQAVAPVQVAVGRTVVTRVLDSPKTLLTILILLLRTEIVVQILFQAIAGIERGIGELDHLLEIGLIDARHLIAVGIVLMIGLIKIDLCQECGGSSLGGATLVFLCLWQGVIGLHQVVDNQLPTLVVAVRTV